MNNFDVILVSSFGQLDPLAVELGRSGLHVLLVDMTQKLGSWPLEDREGPFGVFRFETPLGAWGDVLTVGDLEVSCPDGFVLWTGEGPVGLRGPLAAHQTAMREWRSPDTKWNGEDSFSKWVLCWMARSLQSTRYLEWNPESLQGPRIPLAAPMFVRFPTRPGLIKRNEWIRSQNVTLWEDVEILDGVRSGFDSVSGLEIKGPVNGVIKAQSLVWGLTSLETDHISFRLREKIFGVEVRKPDWAWVRFRLQIEPTTYTERWPLHMVIVENVASPWTHTDFVILHRTVLHHQFDAWVRIPDAKRFHQNYLSSLQKDLLDMLKRKLSQLSVQVVHEPQEVSYTSKELGPRPYSQYSAQMKLKNSRQGALYFDSPEVWDLYSYENMTSNQKHIMDQILVEWRKKKSEESK